jgi:hypothetical protein
MMARVKYEEITDQGLKITTREGERVILEADAIIPSLPLIPDDNLFRTLKGKVAELHQIGDCREFGLMHDAIADGSRIARMI